MNKNSNFLFAMIKLIFEINWRIIAGYMFTAAMVKAILRQFM